MVRRLDSTVLRYPEIRTSDGPSALDGRVHDLLVEDAIRAEQRPDALLRENAPADLRYAAVARLGSHNLSNFPKLILGRIHARILRPAIRYFTQKLSESI